MFDIPSAAQEGSSLYVRSPSMDYHQGKNIQDLHILSAPPVWKVLILDAHTQKILSPIIKVSELRDHDVTLFLYAQK